MAGCKLRGGAVAIEVDFAQLAKQATSSSCVKREPANRKRPSETAAIVVDALAFADEVGLRARSARKSNIR